MRGPVYMAAVLSAACSGSDGNDLTDADSGGPTVDTFDASGYFDASRIYVNAELPYDGRRQVVADIEGNATPPVIFITLASTEWDGTGADVENYCLIGIPLTQAIPRDVSDDARLWFGVTWQEALDPVLSTCNTPGYELNPRRWGSDPVGQLTQEVDYFVAVGAMTPYVADAVTKQAPELDLIGGSIGLPDFFQVSGENPGRVDHVYTFAFEMDATGRLVVDNGSLVEVPSSEAQNNPDQPVYYSLTSLFFWQVP